MSDITVRKIRFDFPAAFALSGTDAELATTLGSLALSLTMPYLEPYLIRTMKVAIPEITDPELAEDARRFSQQEGHHYRNHAAFNQTLREHFGGATAEAIRVIEANLEADYQRFTRTKSLRFNVAYAEGFEAMTCAGALAMAEHGMFDGSAGMMPGGDLWAWHMAEEIEHRTVAFSVFEHLVGSYLYRVVFGTYAQWHYISYLGRFASCMAHALDRKLPRASSPMQRSALRRYLRTFSPFYHPAKLEVPPVVGELLARYSGLAEAEAARASASGVVESLAERDDIVPREPELRVEGDRAGVRRANLKVDLGAPEFGEPRLRELHQHPAEAGALEGRRDGQIVDPAAVPLVADHHGPGNRDVRLMHEEEFRLECELPRDIALGHVPGHDESARVP